nr:uncharacterized protein LOC117860994 isoform X2 [Setaria viridis]
MLLIEPRFQLGPGLVVSSLGSTTTRMLPRNKLINHPSISIQIKETNKERKNRSKRSLAATRILPARPVGAMDRPPPSPRDQSPPPNSQGEHGHGAEVDVPRKTEGVDHLLAKLKNVGMEIDEEMARIIDEEIAGIKAEAMSEREAMDEARRNKNTRWRRLIVPATTTIFGLSLLTIAFASGFSGFCFGLKFYDMVLKKELGVYLNLAWGMKHFAERRGR